MGPVENTTRDETQQGLTISMEKIKMISHSENFLTCLRSVAFLIFSSNSSFVSFFFFFLRSSLGNCGFFMFPVSGQNVISNAMPPLVFGLSIKLLFSNGGNFGTDDSEFFFCNSKRRLSLALCFRGHAIPSRTKSKN